MPFLPFMLHREPLLSQSQLECIESAMLKILERIGIGVRNEQILDQIKKKGFQTNNGRVLFDNNLIKSFIDEERKRNGYSFGKVEITASAEPIILHVSPYPQNIHDLESDKIVPFTSEKLVEATKLVDVLYERGVHSSVPGCPVDVPPALQPVKQYWIGATYSRFGKYPVDAKSAITMPYVMDMAEALGHPIRGLPIYVFSPLNFGSESFDCVMKFRDRLDHVGVGNMASVGCSSPIKLGDAYAMAVAEVIGSAIIVRELTGLNVHWNIRLCPFNMRELAMNLGTPEDLLFQLADSEVNAFFHGTKWSPSASSIHTCSKLPDAQAITEKATLMTVGALLGARRFADAGTLSLDEIFSPEQLLYDCEIKDHVQRMTKGLDVECEIDSCLEEVAQGIDRGFVASYTTLDNYKNQYWHPYLFDRGFLAQWIGKNSPTIRKKTHQLIKDLLKNHEYSLDPYLQKEIDNIYARAESELS